MTSPDATTSSSTAKLSGQSLHALSESIGRPIYWAGARNGVTYEFTETADHRIYVRYLPNGVEAGSPHPYLTVASYPVANAYQVTRAASRKAGAVKVEGPGGAVAFYTRSRPTNVYLAFPGSDVQVELYDPAGRALPNLVAAGKVKLLTAAAAASTADNAAAVRTKAVIVRPSGLHAFAARSGRPVFWVGPVAGTKLELSHSPDGRVYVRYLPKHEPAGTATPYLTVATYPLKGAVAVTRASAARPGQVGVPVAGGGVAFYARSRPTNAYLAFPSADEQVELFAPSAKEALTLVAAAKVRQVP
jgi:hypothetical protein